MHVSFDEFIVGTICDSLLLSVFEKFAYQDHIQRMQIISILSRIHCILKF